MKFTGGWSRGSVRPLSKEGVPNGSLAKIDDRSVPTSTLYPGSCSPGNNGGIRPFNGFWAKVIWASPMVGILAFGTNWNAVVGALVVAAD